MYWKICKISGEIQGIYPKQSSGHSVSVPTSTSIFSNVKVALLTPLEKLLIRIRALCLMLLFGAQISVVFVKTGCYYRLKSVVFSLKDLNSVMKVTTGLLQNLLSTCADLAELCSITISDHTLS